MRETTVACEFRTRFRLAGLWMLLGIATAIAAIVVVLSGKLSAYDWDLVGLACLGTALVYAGLWYAGRTECPGCNWRIGLRANPYRLGERHHRCTSCGIHFDQPSP